uniref:Iso_dh domain-containing protein n=1 Tax=Rhabditophanes sp. KR3021 TaxID=114890 RepID=A0AC35U448_9BILA
MNFNRLAKGLGNFHVMKVFNTAGLKTTSVSLITEKDRFRSPILPCNNLKNKSGGRYLVTVLPGDGIGPEMVEIVKNIFKFAMVPVDFEIHELTSLPTCTEDDFEMAVNSIKRNTVALKGNIETKHDDPTFFSRNMEIRRRLDLYANVLHCATIPNVVSRHQGIDIVMIRENTEGEYSGLEHEAVSGVVESLKVCTRDKLERISRFAFEYAVTHGRKKVTAVHKANIQKVSDGLFLRIVSEMAKAEYPQIQFESMIVDNATMQLVSRPQQFDVMVSPNLYGNVISNVMCGILGGPGIIPGMNVGSEYAVFETGTRNTGSNLAGKNIANPTAFIRAAVDMLKYLGVSEHADLISDALFDVICVKNLRTQDMGGNLSTSDFYAAIMASIEATSQGVGKFQRWDRKIL